MYEVKLKPARIEVMHFLAEKIESIIDELIITRVPELIGTGIPLFGYLDNDLPFEHIRTNIYSNGLVNSQYKRKRAFIKNL